MTSDVPAGLATQETGQLKSLFQADFVAVCCILNDQVEFVKNICLLIHHQTQIRHTVCSSSPLRGHTCMVFLTAFLVKASVKRLVKQINVMF